MKLILSSFKKCFFMLSGKWLLTISYAIRMLLMASSFITPFLFSSIIGYLSEANTRLVYQNILLASLVYIFTIICKASIFFLELQVEKTSRIAIKKNLVRHLLSLHPSNTQLLNTAKVTEIIYGDVNNITTMTFSILGVINDIITVLASGLIIFVINPTLSVVIILLLCVTLLSSNRISRTLSSYNIKIREKTDQNFKLVRDIVINMKNIKISNASKYFSSLFSTDIENINKDIVRRDKTSWYSNAIGTVMENISMIAFLIIGSYEVLNGHMTLPVFIMFSSYSALFSSAITKLFKLNSNTQLLLTSVKRVFELFDVKDNFRNAIGITGIEDMRFVDVSYSYDDKKVIDNFTYEFHKGSCYAIVGQNGSGKTTLLNLAAGILHPDNGEIAINNELITDISYSSLQKLISYYSQDDIVHDISIIDNILLFDGCENIPFGEVESICENLNILTEIRSLPKGFDTLFSDAYTMSYGQKHKLLLAKAFLKPSQVVLLDEPLVGIDVDSQEDIVRLIEKISKDKLVIIVTHRADLFGFVDNIIEIGNEECAAVC